MATILQVMDYAAPYEGNFIPSINNLEKHLNQNGDKMVYLFPIEAKEKDWAINLIKSGKKVYFINRSFFSKKIKISNIVLFLEIIKKERISLIHTHFVTYNYSLFLIRRFISKTPRIVANFMNEVVLPDNAYSKIKIYVIKRTNEIIIGTSKGVTESAIRKGIENSQIVTIYNALDVHHLENFNEMNFNEAGKKKVILMFGWTFERKGVDLVIKALNNIIQQNHELILVIALAGELDVTKQKIIDILGDLPYWIKLIGPTNNVSSYYNSSDIFISASREEGFTYSILEAACCKPLLIVSDIPGHPTDIPRITKFAFENINELEECITSSLQQSKEDALEIKKEQREYVLETYNIDNWSKSIIAIYNLTKIK